MATAIEAVAVALLALGLLLATIGLYGLLRMPDMFNRLHAAGLITGPAVIVVLLASVGTRSDETITSAALMLLFVLVTAPLSGHAIAQAAQWRGNGEETPPRRRTTDEVEAEIEREVRDDT
jgi:monovalent cation/proton antiporter MnhG/PhaG subunit